MGLWDGTNLNTNMATNLVDQFWNDQAINVVSEVHGLLYVLRREMSDKGNPAFDFKKQMVESISGDRLRVKYFNKLNSVDAIQDGVDEVTSQAVAYSGDEQGGLRHDIAHLYKNYGVPNSELKKIQGKEAATTSWLNEKTQGFKADYEDTLGTNINRTTVATARQVNGWQHAVSNGTTNVAGFNETLFAVYGTLNRADAANANLRGNVLDINGVPTLDHVDTLIMNCNRRNGMAKGADLLLAGQNRYMQLKRLVDAKPQVTISQDEKWRKFGGKYFSYSGLTFCVDYKLADDRFGVLDSSTWLLWGEWDNPEVTFLPHPFAPGLLVKVERWPQLVNLSPINNGKAIRCS